MLSTVLNCLPYSVIVPVAPFLSRFFDFQGLSLAISIPILERVVSRHLICLMRPHCLNKEMRLYRLCSSWSICVQFVSISKYRNIVRYVIWDQDMCWISLDDGDRRSAVAREERAGRWSARELMVFHFFAERVRVFVFAFAFHIATFWTRHLIKQLLPALHSQQQVFPDAAST
jgi:hypothetical protein